MCGCTAPLEELREALLDAPGTDTSAVDVFAARRLRPDDAEPLGRAAVVVYGAQVVSSLDDGTRADLEVVGAAGRPLLAILEGVDLPDDALVEAARVPGVSPMSVLPSKRGSFPLRKAMRLLAERSGNAGPSLAARLPAFGRTSSSGSSTPHRAGTASLRRRSGSPAPICPCSPRCSSGWCSRSAPATASSSRRTAPSSSSACSGAGYGMRTVARELLDFIPVAGWAVKGRVAYGGTQALGLAADEYFARGAPADLTKLRTAVERLRQLAPGGSRAAVG